MRSLGALSSVSFSRPLPRGVVCPPRVARSARGALASTGPACGCPAVWRVAEKLSPVGPGGSWRAAVDWAREAVCADQAVAVSTRVPPPCMGFRGCVRRRRGLGPGVLRNEPRAILFLAPVGGARAVRAHLHPCLSVSGVQVWRHPFPSLSPASTEGSSPPSSHRGAASWGVPATRKWGLCPCWLLAAVSTGAVVPLCVWPCLR